MSPLPPVAVAAIMTWLSFLDKVILEPAIRLLNTRFEPTLSLKSLTPSVPLPVSLPAPLPALSAPVTPPLGVPISPQSHLVEESTHFRTWPAAQVFKLKLTAPLVAPPVRPEPAGVFTSVMSPVPTVLTVSSEAQYHPDPFHLRICPVVLQFGKLPRPLVLSLSHLNTCAVVSHHTLPLAASPQATINLSSTLIVPEVVIGPPISPAPVATDDTPPPGPPMVPAAIQFSPLVSQYSVAPMRPLAPKARLSGRA